MNPDATGAGVLAGQIKHFDKLRLQHAAELEHIRHELAKKEHEFYQMSPKDEATEVVREELKLLNNTARKFSIMKAIFEYIAADIQRRHDQPRHKDLGQAENWLPAEPEDYGLEPGWRQRHKPQISAEVVRRY
ncbi:hypothetical protein K458DRAFT_432692 [Lentithecium fluviatile CBS 122367]|uniref:Tubulin-specific chaperone A n=1 Tax=Lentithecium fluviatile CBS 122367 TaxID=1168545 RepID=A0A6G1IWU1_9PLEO|nr:hypothetical protein K458DRAFT_432692 [Lentithecium fluviatile CBS 122367]